MILTIRWGEASPERLRNFATELLRLGVDVIVAGPDSSIDAARQGTSTIPIVMVLSTDPVGSGFGVSGTGAVLQDHRRCRRTTRPGRPVHRRA
jgi:hypothetical protein